MDLKRVENKVFPLILIVLVFGMLFYVSFFYTAHCNSQECFINALKECSKKSFLHEQPSATWMYKIKNTQDSSCEVNVKAISIDSDVENFIPLSGKAMNCFIPLDNAGSFFPEDQLQYCHGLLKETIQDGLLKRMQMYVISNLPLKNEAL